jgi:hypothetical protein
MEIIASAVKTMKKPLSVFSPSPTNITSNMEAKYGNILAMPKIILSNFFTIQAFTLKIRVSVRWTEHNKIIGTRYVLLI